MQARSYSNVCRTNTSHTTLFIKFLADLKELVNCRKGP